MNLLQVMAKHRDFSHIFEGEVAYALLRAHLEDISLNHKKDTFTEADADDLLDGVKRDLELNYKDHWIILPIRGKTSEAVTRRKIAC
jgi:hypothetical protein